MPIRWSAFQVAEAVSKIEGYVNQAIEPLEQAKLTAIQARKIPNLPGYIDQHLVRLIGEIERVTGGVSPWNEKPIPGNVRAAISSIRDSLPEGAVEAEKRNLATGRMQSLL